MTTTEHGYTISSPCEPEGSGELKITEFANTVEPDDMAHYDPSHLDLQILPSQYSGFCIFNIIQFELKTLY